MVRLEASVIQPAPVAPQLEPMARGAVVRVHRDVRAAAHRPVPGGVRGDSPRMMVPLGTFPLEHDVLSGKSNGELFQPQFPRRATIAFSQTMRAMRCSRAENSFRRRGAFS